MPYFNDADTAKLQAEQDAGTTNILGRPTTDVTNDLLLKVVAAGAPPPLPLQPKPSDFEHRAVYVERLIYAMKMHLHALVEDAEQNAKGEKFSGCIPALDDLAGDISGYLNGEAHRIRIARTA